MGNTSPYLFLILLTKYSEQHKVTASKLKVAWWIESLDLSLLNISDSLPAFDYMV